MNVVIAGTIHACGQILTDRRGRYVVTLCGHDVRTSQGAVLDAGEIDCWRCKAIIARSTKSLR